MIVESYRVLETISNVDGTLYKYDLEKRKVAFKLYDKNINTHIFKILRPTSSELGEDFVYNYSYIMLLI